MKITIKHIKQQLILHIPHSSTKIPLSEGYVVSQEALQEELLKLTDWYTDDLFYSQEDEMIRADFSRIFCDPERFTDDSQEVMAQFGMGVLYEKRDNGELMRIVSPEYKERVLTEYYCKHHQKLSQAVAKQVEKFGKALIIDCHSYPSKPLLRDLSQVSERPDFNIGTDAYHTPQHLIDLSLEFFNKAGYTLGIDWPYSGSIVPLEYYQKNKNVHSLMLEINRALYLNEPGNEKSDRYSEIKQVTNDFLKMIKNNLG